MSGKEIPFPLKVKMDTTIIPITIALMPKTIFSLEPNFLDFFDPGDGYYLMHIIQPITNKTIAEQEIVIKEKGNGEAGTNVAYLINDEEILENGLPLQGNYEILISTEFGDTQGSASFSIIESSDPTLESIEEKSIVEEEPDSIIEEATIIPEWIRNIFVFYAEESISDQELINAITFLIEQKIIEI